MPMEDSSLPQDSLFLGFDSSTQSLKATVLDSNLNILATELVHFDSELPHYKTKDGVYRDTTVNGRIVSPTLMWVEAFDLILQKLSKSNLDFGKVSVISGSGQQHGSVYWNPGSAALLSSLDPGKTLVDQLGSAFSIKESPIWMDSSTTAQCREIENAVGGALELSKITGSRAYERFTGPQIRKIFETQPEVYHNTERISLVSSFMASLLIGAYSCIDEADGSGMNLMDIKERVWSKVALEATAPGLEEKLGKLAPSHAVAGLTLSTPGDLAISLGTSDTVIVFMIIHCFLICPHLSTWSLEGHVFTNPVDPENFMVMLVYKNASLTREGTFVIFSSCAFFKAFSNSLISMITLDMRNHCAEKSWDVFNKFLHQTQPLNGMYVCVYVVIFAYPVGFHRYILQHFTGDTLEGLHEKEVEEFDPPSEVRALIEGQFLSMRGHAERFGMPAPPKRIIATGGASANDSILHSIASIFGCDIYTVERPDSASLGAALRAAHGWLCNKKGNFVPISCMYKNKLDKTTLNCKLVMPAGEEKLVSKYALLMKKRMEIENGLVQKFGRN
ncbi:xylulose kinase isoform X1 [Tripterygium wilfordii]|uniref:Xylulose kinase n=1 Tax=Tripterygium wilfordii TaxID=458696 RepID=A0A7J7D0I6_TRIWF|nr:xylulose kinase isoform X1 [Tripterygium wilfordii]